MRRSRKWQGDRWTPAVSRALESRIECRRLSLAEIVGLDDPSEIDELMNELNVEIRRTWALCRDANRSWSDAQIRDNLERLLAEPDQIAERIWDMDPNTRGLIEDFAPRNRPFLEQLASHPDLVTRAVTLALNSLPKPSRGRPRHKISHAEEHLARELGRIFAWASGKPPTRRYREAEEIEYGPFREFVEQILSVFPVRVRGFKSHPDIPLTKSVNRLTKLAVESYRREQSAKSGSKRKK